MTSIILQCAGLIAVLAAVGKAAQGHRRRSLTPNVLYLCGAIGSVGLSAALVSPTSLAWVSTWEPVPNLGRLAANILAMLSAVCVHGLLAHLLHEPARARRVMRLQVPIMVLASAVMTVLLISAGIPYHPAFLQEFADHPAVAAYIVVFALYIGWATSVFGWFLRRYIAQSPRRWLRAGLRTIQAGCVASAAWSVAKITAALLVVSGHNPVAVALVPVAGACAAACVALVAIGATMPVWGPRAAVPVSWAHAVYQARRLRRLWQRLASELPQITLPAEMYAQADARFALYRRVVEIRDAQLVLRSYVHPNAHTWAHQAAEQAGLGSRRTHQVIEAACLAVALDAHGAGQQHQPEPDETTTAPYRGVASDPHTEARWLIGIGRIVERSPIVASVRARARAEMPDQKV